MKLRKGAEAARRWEGGIQREAWGVGGLPVGKAVWPRCFTFSVSCPLHLCSTLGKVNRAKPWGWSGHTSWNHLNSNKFKWKWVYLLL